MRILLKRLIPALVLLISTSAYAEYRIATVDLGRVFTNYWKTKQAQIALDEKKSDFDKTEKDKVAAFTKAKEDYQKMLDSMKDPAVSAQEREKRKNSADDMLKDLKDQDQALTEYDRYVQNTMHDQLQRTRDNIVADIRVAITAKAKAEGYTLVIDTAAQTINQTPVILYSVPNDSDITEAVIKQINAGAPVDLPKGEDKPVAKPDDKAAPRLDDKLMK
jgi:outer membrane protein